MMPIMQPKERVTITVDADLLKRVDYIAESRGDSRSAVLERVVANGIDEEESLLETLGVGVQGRLVAQLLRHPRLARALAEVVVAEVSPEVLDRMEKKGGELVDAAERFRRGRKNKGSDRSGGKRK